MMWNDEKDNLFEILELLNKNKIDFPTTCPSCHNNDCHIYIHDNGESVGSLWIWCSHCMEYIHATYIIPNWWKNCPNIKPEKLQVEPSYLENNKEIIDEWVNNLLKNITMSNKNEK